MSDDEVDEDLLLLLRQSMQPTAKPKPGNPVLDDAEYIYNHAADVAIDMKGTKAAAQHIYESMLQKGYSAASWAEHELHPKTKTDDTVAFIFTMDLLNFSFWSEVPFAVDYAGKSRTGYWSLVAVLQRALREHVPATTPHWWVESSDQALLHVFRASTSMPMLEERIRCLREAGAVLVKDYEGSIVGLVQSAEGSAVRLLHLLVENFPCLDDCHEHDGRRLCFYKRAQIFIADLWASFEGTGIGAFHDIDKITMFADYRIPQMLHSLGCLIYSPPLEATIRRLDEIPSGSWTELQLRGCSIWCVELIRRLIQQAYPSTHINAILIDFFLYDVVKAMVAQGHESIPHHRTRSIWY